MAEHPEFPRIVSTSKTSRFLILGAATVLSGPGNFAVVGTVNTANGSWTLTLPALAEGTIGDTVYVYATVADSKVRTLADKHNDSGSIDLSLNANGEYVILQNCGHKWVEIATGYA